MSRSVLMMLACCAAASTAAAQEPRTDRSPQVLTGRDTTLLTVYSQTAFSGHSFTLTRDTGNISSMAPIESLRTTGGRWQICEGHGYRGECRLVEGRYMTLSSLGLKQVRSARPVEPARGN